MILCLVAAAWLCGAAPIDRLILGPGIPYAADTALRDETSWLAHSQRARRRRAWEVVARMVQPVPLAHGGELPLMQTWYGPEEVLLLFDHLLRGLGAAAVRARAGFGVDAIGSALDWQAGAAPRLPGYSQRRYLARLGELADPAGLAGLGGIGRTRLAPRTVEGVLSHYATIEKCLGGSAACIPGGLSGEAATVKLHFVERRALLRYDTRASGLRRAVQRGQWEGEALAGDPEGIYSVRHGDNDLVLAAMHIATKELADWFWVTLWWSDDPDSDFGADRPALLGAPWNHYKMCVVSDYKERDVDPRGGFNGGLGDALAVVHGDASWCSNPYLETGARNVLSNCMGCHQHGGSGRSVDGILAQESELRQRVRAVFLSDYLWVLDAGVELGQEMRNRVEGLSSP